MNWRFKLSIRLALLRAPLLAASILAACAEHPGISDVTSPDAALLRGSNAPIKSLTVTPGVATIPVGGTVQLTSVMKDAAGNLLTGRTTVWSVAGNAVSVSASGMVTGLRPGTAAVSGMNNLVSGSAQVTVASSTPVVATVTITPGSVSVTAGATTQLTAVVKDAAGNVMGGAPVTWSTSAAARATVAIAGLVTGVTAGTATIMATSGGTSGSAAVTVTAAPAGGGAVSVTGVSRDAGSANGGTALTITGTGFTGSPAVSFGGVAASNVVVVNSTTLNVTAPAHAAGIVNIAVGGATLSQGYEYLPAPTVVFASHDFEDGTLGAFRTNIAAGTVAASTDRAFAGTRSAKSSVTAMYAGSGAALSYVFSGALSNPALSANGVYMRWYMYLPSATVTDARAAGHQIKTHLFRQVGGSGQPGWLMPGIGADFPPSDGSLTAFIDNGILAIPGGYTGVKFGDGVWHEIQIWMKRSGGQGRARMWVDGRQRLDVTNAAMGSDNPAAVYNAMFGLVYSESGGPLTAYVDNVMLQDGFVEP